MKRIHSKKFSSLVIDFLSCYKSFDQRSNEALCKTLDELLLANDPDEKSIIQLHEALFFCLAYPYNAEVFQLASRMMEKIMRHVRAKVAVSPDSYYNSGITGSNVCAVFGLYFNQYLLKKNTRVLELSGIDGEQSDLVSKLTFTLDSVEQELMPEEAGYFKVWKKQFVPDQRDNRKLLKYYVNTCLQLNGSMSFKEHVFGGFTPYTLFSLDESMQGMSHGRLKNAEIHFHPSGLQKKITLAEVLNEGRPKPIRRSETQKSELVTLARGSMASLLRETDTFTYAQTSETELFDMGKGIRIALYYMVPEQKYSLQSYVGYLLFKNGVPMAYGGCWLFGFQAAFGVNVLPPYRGGESANVVGQLLRLYHFRFGIHHFSVDPYQIGKNNEDGIKSGAFWFYYKLGFRPIQPHLAALASEEIRRMGADPMYRSDKKILKKLADSEIKWSIDENSRPYFSLSRISGRVSEHILHQYDGDRDSALKGALNRYKRITGTILPGNSFARRLIVFMEAIGALDKLRQDEIIRLAEIYHTKSEEEASAFLSLQKQKTWWKLMG